MTLAVVSNIGICIGCKNTSGFYLSGQDLIRFALFEHSVLNRQVLKINLARTQDQTSMAQYALFARATAREGVRPKTVLDQHNALHLLVQRQARYERGWLKRLIWRREARLLRDYERGVLTSFDQILTVTADDREALLQLLERDKAEQVRKHIKVVPICVDPERHPMLPINWESAQILHLGTMFWPPNVEGVLWKKRTS